MMSYDKHGRRVYRTCRKGKKKQNEITHILRYITHGRYRVSYAEVNAECRKEMGE